MKKSYIFLVFALFSLVVSAQDMVKTKTGEQINCYITKEDSSSVSFRFKRNDIQKDTTMLRSDIDNFRYSVLIDESLPKVHAKTCLSIGAGLGGATFAGVDFEYMLSKSVGIQAGVGYLGAGGAINYHFFPTVRSSYISLQYWCKGLSNNADYGYRSTMVGPAIVYRGKKWLTFQVGAGYILDKGPAYEEGSRDFKVGLTMGLGVYFPVK
jgi:hypothetical protein